MEQVKGLQALANPHLDVSGGSAHTTEDSLSLFVKWIKRIKKHTEH